MHFQDPSRLFVPALSYRVDTSFVGRHSHSLFLVVSKARPSDAVARRRAQRVSQFDAHATPENFHRKDGISSTFLLKPSCIHPVQGNPTKYQSASPGLVASEDWTGELREGGADGPSFCFRAPLLSQQAFRRPVRSTAMVDSLPSAAKKAWCQPSSAVKCAKQFDAKICRLLQQVSGSAWDVDTPSTASSSLHGDH